LCKETFLSIILPTYNSEETISGSIKSITKQNYNNFELIIINDGSTDNTLKICERLRKENKRIKIINFKKNLGVSKARNEGLKKARGEYIIFLDSDDNFLKNFFSELNRLIIKKKSKLIIANNIYIRKKLSNRTLLKNLFLQNKLSYFCWNYVINRKVLLEKKIFFNNLKIFEDQLFVLRLITSIKDYVFYRKKFIKRFERLGSLGRTTNYSSCYACLINLNMIINLKEKIKNKMIRKFLKFKIDESYKYFKLYSLVLNKNEVKNLSKNCEKIFNFKNSSNFYFREIKRHQKVNKKFLLELTNTIQKKKVKYFYLYSAGLYSRIMIKLTKIKFKNIFDSNHTFHNKKIKNVRILFNNEHISFSKKVILIPKNIKVKKKEIKKIGFNQQSIKLFNFDLKTNLLNL